MRISDWSSDVCSSDLYVRVDADGDVAVDGLDAAAQLGGDDADRAVDRFDALGDVAAAADEDAAVDRLDAAADARPLADVDVAVDGAQVLGLDVVAGLDPAVDGLCVPGVRAVFQADAAVDGFQVAVHLPGLGGDAAVHLVDVGAVGRRGHGAGSQQQRQREGQGKAGQDGHGVDSGWNDAARIELRAEIGRAHV